MSYISNVQLKGNARFFIPDSKIHGFIHPFENIDDELSKPYIEVTRRKKGILVEL